jgi:hypothetical protein
VYDRQGGVLVYYWTCEVCGDLLGEAHRESYRPRYDPRGAAQAGAQTLTPLLVSSRTRPSAASRSRWPSTSESVR